MAMPPALAKKLGAAADSSDSSDDSSSSSSDMPAKGGKGDPAKVGTASPDNPLMKWAAAKGK